MNNSTYGRLDKIPFEFSAYENHSRKRAAPVANTFSASQGCPEGVLRVSRGFGLTRIIPVSGQLQLRTLLLLPEGIPKVSRGISAYENHSHKRAAPVTDTFSASRGCPEGVRLRKLRRLYLLGPFFRVCCYNPENAS